MLLALAVVVGGGLRLVSVAHKLTPGHDEAVSYIHATCHADDYERVVAERSYPYGVPAPAGAWQRFWDVDRRLCFSAIARGLAHTDIHPPLYFWLLHVWSLIAGVGLSQAVWLNLLLVTLTAGALFGLGREAFGDDVDASLLGAIWVLSPATIGTSTEARPYDLFALVTVLFVWQVLRVTRPGGRLRPADAASLVAATAAGALTNFVFVFVAAGASVVAAIRLLPGQGRRLLAVGASTAAGLLVFVIVHPSFTQSLQRQRRRGTGFEAAELGERVDRVLSTLADYALGRTQYSPGKGGFVAAVMVALVAVLGVIWLRRWGRDPPSVDRHMRGASLAFMAMWMGGGIVALYLASVTPGHAMGARYLAAAWPFFAAVPILLVRFAGRYRMPLAALLVAVTLTAGITSARRVDQANAALPYPGVLADDQRAVLLDTDRRGLLAPALWRIPAQRTVLAASQRELLAHPRRWLAGLNGRRVAYVSASTLGGTSAGRQRIRRRITSSGRGIRAAGRVTLWDSRNVVGATTERVYAVSRPQPRASRDTNPDAAR